MISHLAETYLRTVSWLTAAGAVVAAVSLVFIPVLIGAEILSRAVLGASVGIAWEYATYLMTFTFLLGAAYAMQTGGHVRVSLLSFAKYPRLERAVEIFAAAFAALAVLVLALGLTDLAWQAYARGTVSSTPARTPLVVPRGLVALGAWLLLLQLFARIVGMLSGRSIETAPPGEAS